MMLGIEDPYIIAAYVLSITFALISLAYGLLKWNQEVEEDG